MANCKTAVSILQEQCARQGMTPIYSTISQEGRSHQPKFTISCTAGPTVGTGEGVSKKSAKQAAAEAVLQQWEVELPKLDSAKAETVDTPNPVGELQELVTLLGWRRPEYEELEETGPPHDRSFVVGVTVGKFKEQGTDKSKRLAKRTAANAMLETIRALPPDADPGIEPGTIKPKKKQGGDAKKTAACTLQNAEGPAIDKLCSHPVNFPASEAQQILHLIATEQKFATSYADLAERGPDNACQCLVEMQTSPVAVCHGAGPTAAAAQASAAYNALFYVRTMRGHRPRPPLPPPPTDPSDVLDSFEPPSRKNPVQMLNELHATPLQFVVERRDGPPHDPVYALSLTVDGSTFRAEARKKQAAKEQLARRALREVFGVVSTAVTPGEGGATNRSLSPTPSDLYGLWRGREAYTWADHIQGLVERQLRQVTFRAGQTTYARYKVLAGVVQTVGDDVQQSEVVCLATGTKCPLAESPDTEGRVVTDCHAEVVARRCLRRYLTEQLGRHWAGASAESIFTGAVGAVARVRDGVRFHLYISCPPCGDASSFTKEGGSMGRGDGHPNCGARGLLRAKIRLGESTIPLTGKAGAAPGRLFAMSCSDKAAGWNVLGLQGALLSHALAPVYPSSVVLGAQCHPDHVPRALYGRLTDLPAALPPGFRLNKPLVVGATAPSGGRSGSVSPSARSPGFSVNWIRGDGSGDGGGDGGGIEVIATDTGLTKEGSPSRVSKGRLLSAFAAAMGALPEEEQPRRHKSSSRGGGGGGEGGRGGGGGGGGGTSTKPHQHHRRERGRKTSGDEPAGRQGSPPPPAEKLQGRLRHGSTYRELKDDARDYQACKALLKQTFLAEGLGRWLVKPKLCDNFSC